MIDDNAPRNSIAQWSHNFLSRDGMNPMEILKISRDQLRHYDVKWIWGRVLHFNEEKDQVTITYASIEDPERNRIPADDHYTYCAHEEDAQTLTCRVVRAIYKVLLCLQLITVFKVLIATGSEDNYPSVKGFEEINGISGHHCPFCDGYEHRNEHIVVYGMSTHSKVNYLYSW